MLARRIVRGPRRPTWSLRTETTVFFLRASLDRSMTWGVDWFRAFQNAIPLKSPLMKQVRFDAVRVAGIPCEWCEPPGHSPNDGAVLYFHGGGYVYGNVAMYRDTVARIALGTQHRVLAVDYRLGPEHPFPAAQDDCLAAFRAVVKEGTPSTRIALAGDSAGGCLCLATMLGLRDAGEALPAAAALISPWVQPSANTGSMIANEPFDIFDRAWIARCAELYMNGADWENPLVAPVNADLHGLPPLLIHAGGAEILLDQIVRLRNKASAAGVPVDYSCFEDMFHVFHITAAMLPEGQLAMTKVSEFLSGHLDLASR